MWLVYSSESRLNKAEIVFFFSSFTSLFILLCGRTRHIKVGDREVINWHHKQAVWAIVSETKYIHIIHQCSYKSMCAHISVAQVWDKQKPLQDGCYNYTCWAYFIRWLNCRWFTGEHLNLSKKMHLAVKYMYLE